jgi:cell wall-associated NlpC family hydrolase
MTAVDDSAVVKRWRRRVQIRRNLLKRAEARFAAATGDERQDAKALVKLRREQVEFAERVVDHHEVPKLTARERAVRAAMLGVKHRDQISYSQNPTARWDGIHRECRAYKGQFPKSADCSSFVTWCIWDALGGPKAGADRVNGSHWAAGYTGTQCSNGKRVDGLAHARPGDLLFYRGSNGQIGHVTMYIGDGKCVSHGSDPGPMILRPDYRPIAEIRSYLP